MDNNQYRIVDDFQVRHLRVLVLERDFDSYSDSPRAVAKIEGKEYRCSLNSIRKWVTIESNDSFKGKIVEFL